MATAPLVTLDRDTPAGVLGALAAAREVARQAEISTMQAALEWAAMHSANSLADAMTVPGTDRTLAIAGQGAPFVAEFAIGELATALGRSADSAKLWLGTVLEIRHRLPKTWARMVNGPLEPWRARQIANATLGLCWDAAGWVDHQIAPIAHKIGPAQLERVIADAVRRFDPEQAYEDELANAEARHVTVHDRYTTDGLVEVTATLDAIDAHDLDVAVGQTAHTLLVAGCAESLDVRRALALGEIARHELTLDLDTGEMNNTASGSDATLYVHFDAADIDLLDDQTGADQPTALIEKTGGARDYTIGIDHLRDWLTRPGTTVTIRPVIDLADTIKSRGYHPSPTLREQVILRNRTCVFPHCTRTARTADLDHIQPWDGDHGGKTVSANLAPLCRLHHRAKTHHQWTYTPLAPGEFLWHSPHGANFHVDPTGTTALEADGPPRHTPRDTPRP